MNTNLSAQKRQTRDRAKMMITYHFSNVSNEIRFVEWCKTNRISPTVFGDAITELISEGKAKRGGTYLVPGIHGYESYQVFVAVPVATIEEDINVRFCESCGRGWSVAA
jgi:hypothetical protein